MNTKKKLFTWLCAISLLLNGTQSINVNAAKKTVSLSKNRLTLKIGDSARLKVKAKTNVKICKKKFSTTNKKIVTVNKKGKISAKKKGNAYITVNVTYQNVKTINKTSLKCRVTVMQNNVINTTLIPSANQQPAEYPGSSIIPSSSSSPLFSLTPPSSSKPLSETKKPESSDIPDMDIYASPKIDITEAPVNSSGPTSTHTSFYS